MRLRWATPPSSTFAWPIKNTWSRSALFVRARNRDATKKQLAANEYGFCFSVSSKIETQYEAGHYVDNLDRMSPPLNGNRPRFPYLQDVKKPSECYQHS
jgi:hypothetical protein